MPTLHFSVVGGGDVEVEVKHLFNGGYAGRDTAAVQHHIDELAALGVPGPATVPTLYPLAAMQASQAEVVDVPHDKTSGEAEWALIVPAGATSPDDYLVTVACDHTDRALEVHGVAWSKQSAPDVLGTKAWRWGDVRDSFDQFTLRAWVTNDGVEELISDGSPADLLSPDYWIERMGEAGLIDEGTVVMSGTIPMIEGVNQFSDGWRVELADPHGNAATVNYRTNRLPDPWQ